MNKIEFMMQDFPLLKRLYYRHLAFVFSFTYRTTRRHLLGFSLSSWIKLVALVPLFLAWIRKWDGIFWVLALLLVVWVFFAYWGARRAGYVRFISRPASSIPTADLEPLPHNQRTKIWVTGVLTVNDWEEYVLLRPAEYWQVPLGDHIVMAQAGENRFLYQFFDAENLGTVEPGCLLFGTCLQHTIALTFMETHFVIEPMQFNFASPNEVENTTSNKRVLYFTFSDEATQRAVWYNFLYDTRRVRS